MKPYKVKFILDEKTGRHAYAESNDKPLKGEVFTLKESTGKLKDIKITEVNKYLIAAENDTAIIEYWCIVEEYKAGANTIGFSNA